MPLKVEVVCKYISIKYTADKKPLLITAKDAAKWAGENLDSSAAKRALLSGGKNSTIIGLSLFILKKLLKFPARPVAGKNESVVYEITLSKDAEVEFGDYVKTKQFEAEIAEKMENLELFLKDILGDKFDASGPDILKDMKNVGIEVNGLCEKPADVEADAAPQGKSSGAKPLPPTNIQVTYGERYPNTEATVFFDDPNDDVCDYVITALDTDTNSAITLDTPDKFGVMDGLLPNRQYVFYVEALLGGVRSEKSFYKKPIKIFKKKMEVGYTVNRQGNTVNFSWTRVAKATKYELKVADVDSVELVAETTEDLSVSVSSSNINLGFGCFVHVKAIDEDGGVLEEVKKWWNSNDLKLWGSGLRVEFAKVFGDKFPDQRMKEILAACYQLGIMEADDLKFLKGTDNAKHLELALKPVEISKLRQHNVIPTIEIDGIAKKSRLRSKRD